MALVYLVRFIFYPASSRLTVKAIHQHFVLVGRPGSNQTEVVVGGLTAFLLWWGTTKAKEKRAATEDASVKE